MAYIRPTLAVDRMSIDALFARAKLLVLWSKWESGYSVQQRDRFLHELDLCLDEIKLRGYQLSIENLSA